jgi:hypothetical protein
MRNEDKRTEQEKDKLFVIDHTKKLRGRSPQANYTDRATTSCRRS